MWCCQIFLRRYGSPSSASPCAEWTMFGLRLSRAIVSESHLERLVTLLTCGNKAVLRDID